MRRDDRRPAPTAVGHDAGVGDEVVGRRVGDDGGDDVAGRDRGVAHVDVHEPAVTRAAGPATGGLLAGSTRLASPEICSCNVISRSYRAATTAAGTCIAIVAAGVPGRGEYWNVNALVNRDRATTSRVASKSSSVSPGNPTMMSVVMAACGIAARTRSMIPR